MIGLSTKSYLTRNLLNKIFKKKMTLDEIDSLLMSGKIIKRFSYYQPSEALLRDLKIIPNTVRIEKYNHLAKHASFVLSEIREIFSNCHVDTARLIAAKYFYKKYNYYYKNEALIELLSEGGEYVSI